MALTEINGVPVVHKEKDNEYWSYSEDGKHAIKLFQYNGLWYFRRLRWDENRKRMIAYTHHVDDGSGYYEIHDAMQAARSKFSAREVTF